MVTCNALTLAGVSMASQALYQYNPGDPPHTSATEAYGRVKPPHPVAWTRAQAPMMQFYQTMRCVVL